MRRATINKALGILEVIKGKGSTHGSAPIAIKSL